MPLIAKVAVRLVDKGVRVEIPPGDEIPAGLLAEHDQRELLASGAIEDTDATAEAGKAQQKSVAAAGKEFQAARRRVTAAAESTKPSAAKKSGANQET